jgi:FlaA1/EpsC-like NDP-sugar epimerase
MMEENPVAAIENNFFGTLNLFNAARKHQVKRFVLITTDKAVDPVSVYGVSNYLCERLVLDAAASCGPEAAGHFMVVRFGNVLGSRGSIMPLFQQQIEKGGPVTVTDPQMYRWFMTIPEACSLVLKAGGVGRGGNLYLLDMGEPIRIKDMAEQMIRFYGFEPEKDIRIEFIGPRPGERLDETLWGADETPTPTEHSRILKVERKTQAEIDMDALTKALRPICVFDPEKPNQYRDSALLRRILHTAIPSLIMPKTAAGSVKPASCRQTAKPSAEAPREQPAELLLR